MTDRKGLLGGKGRDEPPASPFVGTSTGEYEVHRPKKKFSIAADQVVTGQVAVLDDRQAVTADPAAAIITAGREAA